MSESGKGTKPSPDFKGPKDRRSLGANGGILGRYSETGGGSLYTKGAPAAVGGSSPDLEKQRTGGSDGIGVNFFGGSGRGLTAGAIQGGAETHGSTVVQIDGFQVGLSAGERKSGFGGGKIGDMGANVRKSTMLHGKFSSIPEQYGGSTKFDFKKIARAGRNKSDTNKGRGFNG